MNVVFSSSPSVGSLHSCKSVPFTSFKRECLDFDKVNDYSNCYFPFIGEKLRNEFYLPVMDLEPRVYDNVDLNDPNFFEKNTLNYLISFTKMLKNEEPGVDPTFQHFTKLQQNFTIKDLPVEIKAGSKTYLCNVRVVETKAYDKKSEGIRFVLFSFYGNKQLENGDVKPWDPKSLEALGKIPIEVLKALESQMKVDSLMCFSLGALTLDALKDVDEDVLPETIVIDRGLTSIKKVAPRVTRFPLALHSLASCYYLDADPEESLLLHLEKINPLVQKKIVVIEASDDRYFSKESGYGENYFARIEAAGAEVLHGKFFLPYTDAVAHHALRKDWLFNNQNSGTQTDHFIPIGVNEKLSDALTRYLTQDGKHTCFIVGGNKDSLDSLLYGCTPLLESYIIKS